MIISFDGNELALVRYCVHAQIQRGYDQLNALKTRELRGEDVTNERELVQESLSRAEALSSRLFNASWT